MKRSLIYNSSLNFSRAVYGILILTAFLIRNQWLVLLVVILLIVGTFSIKFNIFYQFHSLVLRKLLKKKSKPIQKELKELNFVSGMTGVLLFIGFLFLYFEKFIDIAWFFILIMSLLMFAACFIGFCVATLMYVFLKKIFKRQ